MVNYIVVDDEPIAHDIVISYAKNLSSLKLVGQAYNAFEAIELLQSKKIDLIFLDIEMPQLKGLDFLKTLNNVPKVIVTTAYEEYALEGYELNVVDYLLKPFSFERFMKAVNKVFLDNASSQRTFFENRNKVESIFIKENSTTHHVKIDDIIVIESMGNYVKVYTGDKTIVSPQSLQYFEEKLVELDFIRIHRSFIINLGYITLIEGNFVLIHGRKIPIGRTYKMNFLNKIDLN